MVENKVVDLPSPIRLVHDRELWISTGRGRTSKKWKNQQMKLSALVRKLSESKETSETFEEYKAMKKDEQSQVKDVGGFVGGTIKGGRRIAGSIETRSLLTLDLDFAPLDVIEDVKLLYDDLFMIWYSTHSHSEKTPRYRLVMPLSRDVDADEYQAVARMVAKDIGILDYVDPTTFQPERLMYWPSHAIGGAVVFDYTDGDFIDVDKVKSRYPNGNWSAAFWPTSERESKAIKKAGEKQGEPTEKPGIVGAFCRAYDIHSAIATFLSDIYVPTDQPDRYTYALGSTAAGLVVYQDGAFAYSNHGTDPAQGTLCNAFDLVRLHKFGDKDSDAREDTTVNNLPSHKAMEELALANTEVLKELDNKRYGNRISAEDFEDDMTIDDIRAKLERTGKGVITKSIVNAATIFKLDPNLKGIRLDKMSNAIRIDPLYPVPWKRPNNAWSDTDEARLTEYLAANYAEFGKDVIHGRLVVKADDAAYHPVIDYLRGLPVWDEVPRVDTLLIDYLGAEDNVYTRQATHKMLMAAVCRVMHPGVKFDNLLVLSGPPASGKSTLINRLAGDWFTDNLTFEDMRNKDGAEKLQGYWIAEISEMKGLRGMDVGSVKAFISRRVDIYRAAYGRNTEEHPRQSVLFGTVNDVSGFLKDVTGNRRYWPIEVTGEGVKKSWDMTDDDVKQIWAEVMHYYDLGETSLILEGDAIPIAEEKQRAAMETDEKEGLILDFLEKEIPVNWSSYALDERRDYWAGEHDFLPDDKTEPRKFVSVAEIWCECYGNRYCDLKSSDSYSIKGILVKNGWVSHKERARSKAYGRQRVFRAPGTTFLSESKK